MASLALINADEAVLATRIAVPRLLGVDESCLTRWRLDSRLLPDPLSEIVALVVACRLVRRGVHAWDAVQVLGLTEDFLTARLHRHQLCASDFNLTRAWRLGNTDAVCET